MIAHKEVNHLKSIIVALIFNAFDLISGIIAAVKAKSLKSSALRDGLFKKTGFVFCYILALLIDKYGEMIGLPIGMPILPVVVGYAVLTETVSIIENICKINPDLLPDKLLELFQLGGDNHTESR